MNTLLIIAHPERRSFNHALAEVAQKTLASLGHSVELSDLYSMDFNPAAGPRDVPAYTESGLFQLAKAQRWAHSQGGFAKDIAREQDKLRTTERLILQFPLWWGSFPAILKGWIDRVLSSGFAYGRTSNLEPKRVLFSVTTGGAEGPQEETEYRLRVERLTEDVFGFLGWEMDPPFIAHGVQRLEEEKRQSLLLEYETHLRRVLDPDFT